MPGRQLRFLPVVVALALVAALGVPERDAGAASAKCSKRGKAAKAKRCRALTRSRWRRVKQRRRRSAGRFGSNNRLFARDSVWNLPVSSRTQLDPGSQGRVDALAGFIESQAHRPPSEGGGYPNINADAYSTPIYRVPRGTDRVRVELPPSRKSPTLRKILATGVPIPSDASPAAGLDAHMTVYQPSSGVLWELWHARKTAGGWRADWAGAMRRVSHNAGYYDSTAWRGLDYPDGWHWGATASSLPVAAGTVTLAELYSGRIDHALAMSFANTCRDIFAWPAQRTDGRSPESNCIPLGTHFRLDPSLDVASLNLHPVARQLAEAAQRYGIIVRDRTRVSAAFFLESPAPGRPSPYAKPGGLYGGTPSWKVLMGFPWSRLQVLPLHLCTRAPCRPGS